MASNEILNSFRDQAHAIGALQSALAHQIKAGTIGSLSQAMAMVNAWADASTELLAQAEAREATKAETEAKVYPSFTRRS